MTSDSAYPSNLRPIKMLSRWYYAVGGFVIAATIAVFIIFLLTEVLNQVPNIRVAVPGSREISINHSGKYTIFYEYKSSIDGKKYSTGKSLDSMWIRLESTDGTENIQLSNSSGKSSYEVWNNRAGVSLVEFKINHPGKYVLTAEYQDGSTGPEVVFAIGKFTIFRAMLKAIGILAFGLVIGSLAILWVYTKRDKAQEANNSLSEISGI